MKGANIVVIGGGTGLSTMLRGLKKFTSNITAIVTVADNGGGSGILREEMKMLPPGDIRNCILALANTEPIMEKLLQYRFTDGSLKGQSFGNLFLAAMNGICGSFEEAVKSTSEVLAVTGKVLPVTSEDVHLCARLSNRKVICGESQIVQATKKTKASIKEVFLEPANPKALSEVLQSLCQADAIVLGPGSLYTSIIPNLLVDGVTEAIKKSNAMKVYISNIMTQPGETEGYDLIKHIRTIEKYGGKDIIDYVIVNIDPIPDEMLEIYKKDGAAPVSYKKEELEQEKFRIIESSVMKIYGEKQLVRHDPEKLAITIMKRICSKKTSLFWR